MEDKVINREHNILEVTEGHVIQNTAGDTNSGEEGEMTFTQRKEAKRQREKVISGADGP